MSLFSAVHFHQYTFFHRLIPTKHCLTLARRWPFLIFSLIGIFFTLCIIWAIGFCFFDELNQIQLEMDNTLGEFERIYGRTSAELDLLESRLDKTISKRATTTFSENNCPKKCSSTCPPGPPGFPGLPGLPGESGEDGHDGEPGAPGIALLVHQEQPGCIVCPQGPPGPIGPIGPIGDSGMDGLPGHRGKPGKDGQNGEDGEPGELGELGPDGSEGPEGEAGNNVIQKVGQTGRKGPKGAIGPRGEPGMPGTPAASGGYGLPGPQGPSGMAGLPGLRGAPGQPGMLGAPGTDGQYCPCPRRSGKMASKLSMEIDSSSKLAPKSNSKENGQFKEDEEEEGQQYQNQQKVRPNSSHEEGKSPEERNGISREGRMADSSDSAAEMQDEELPAENMITPINKKEIPHDNKLYVSSPYDRAAFRRALFRKLVIARGNSATASKSDELA